MAKKIQKAADNRIPELLSTSSKGRKKTTVIVQGTDLYEKIKNVYGGKSIRSAAKIMWSPLYEQRQSEFINIVLRYSKYRTTFKPNDTNKYPMETIDWLYKYNIECTNGFQMSAIESVSSLYLELFEMNSEAPAWKNYFI